MGPARALSVIATGAVPVPTTGPYVPRASPALTTSFAVVAEMMTWPAPPVSMTPPRLKLPMMTQRDWMYWRTKDLESRQRLRRRTCPLPSLVVSR